MHPSKKKKNGSTCSKRLGRENTQKQTFELLRKSISSSGIGTSAQVLTVETMSALYSFPWTSSTRTTATLKCTRVAELNSHHQSDLLIKSLRAHTHAHTHTCTHTHMHTHAHTHAHTHMPTHAHTCLYTCPPTHTCT